MVDEIWSFEWRLVYGVVLVVPGKWTEDAFRGGLSLPERDTAFGISIQSRLCVAGLADCLRMGPERAARYLGRAFNIQPRGNYPPGTL